VSKSRKAQPEFVPKVIEADDGDDFVAFIPQQIGSDWHEKWGPLLEGFPLNILYAGITNKTQESSAPSSPSPNTTFEPEVIDYYPEDETCFGIVGGIKPRKKPGSPKKWLPTGTRRPSVRGLLLA